MLDIDETDLNEADKIRVRAYVSERNNLIKEIKMMLGDMTASVVRQKLKSLQKDSVVNSVKKFLNEYQGHNEGELEDMTLEQPLITGTIKRGLFCGTFVTTGVLT